MGKRIRLRANTILPKYKPEEYSEAAIAALMPAVKRREQDAINRVILLLARLAIKIGRCDEELQLQALEKLVETVVAMSNRPQEEKCPRSYIISTVYLHILKRRIKNNLFHVSPQFFKKTGKEFSRKYLAEDGYKSDTAANFKRKQEKTKNDIQLFTMPPPDWSFAKETLEGMRPMVKQVIELRMAGMDDTEIGRVLNLTKARIGQLRKEAQDYARKRFSDNGMGEIVSAFEKQSAQSRGLPDDGGRVHDSADTEAGTRA